MHDQTTATTDQLSPAPALARYAEAVPLAAFTAHRLGPLEPPTAATADKRLERFASGPSGKLAAVDTAGSVGRLLLALIGHYGGSLTVDRLAYETASADPIEIELTIERLRDARLLKRGEPADDLVLDSEVAQWWTAPTMSLADQHAITSDALTLICKRHRLDPPSNKKHDKIAAITKLFADPDRRTSVMNKLSDTAVKMLTTIADADGLRPVDVEHLGIDYYQLRFAEAPRFPSQPTPDDEMTAALAELSWLGIVGVSDYERQAWIWSEAWPLLNRPVYDSWPSSPALDIIPRSCEPIRLPAIVSQFDRVLRHWLVSPPPMLKNREKRLGKPVVRSTAKALNLDPEVLELVSFLAMAMELVVPTPVSTSGSGRNATTTYAWAPDPDAWTIWSSLPPTRKWMTFLTHWSRQSPSWGDQLLANRLLLWWEVARLAPETGFDSDEALAGWIEHRYQPVGSAAYGLAALNDLRALDVVTAEGAVALTALGRLAVDDLAAVESVPFGDSDHAIVQADLTVVTPPDLAPELVARLAMLADLESDASAGASVYRLNDTAIARAVQADESSESIAAFLVELSSVPVDDVVLRFVADAASTADKVKIIEAPSVLVTTDPVDLTLACGLKPAKLTPVTPTVALSSLTAEKLRTVLAKKGLSPRLVVDTASRPERRSSRSRADELERRAEQYRDMAARNGNDRLRREAKRLTTAAAETRDPALRWHRPFSFPSPGSVAPGPGRAEGRPS